MSSFYLLLLILSKYNKLFIYFPTTQFKKEGKRPHKIHLQSSAQKPTLAKQPTYMLLLKEHFTIGQNNQRCRRKDNNRLYTLGLRCHGNFLLHGIDKKMKNNTRKHASIIFYINPSCQKSHGHNAYQKVQYIQYSKLRKAIMICSLNPK